MQNTFSVIVAIAFILVQVPHRGGNEASANKGNYSFRSFFVKTHSELAVSEATGKIMLTTGIADLDNEISDAGITEIKQVFRLNNGDRESYYRHGMNRIYLLVSQDKDIEGLENIVNKLNRSDELDYSELNYIGNAAGQKEVLSRIPSDEMFFRQWYLMNTGNVNPSGGGGAKIGADINMLNAWDIETGNDTIVVAILDSGIKDDHPDLRQRIWINKNEIPNNGIDDDNNGYIDDIKGWDFAYNDKRPNDGFGHGTNIATVIGASSNNSLGFAGVDWKCRLMNCKNLNSDNSGEYSWWSESIKYAVDNGAHIINMSEGGDEYSRTLKTAVNYALDNGVMVIASMMNKGDNRDYYPAVYEGVFAVGATDTDDSRCKRFSWGGGSCWGKHIAVVAPGNKIYGLDYEDDSNYEVYWSGTSQSTAIVSGLAALLLAQNPGIHYKEIQKIIEETAKDRVGDPREDTPGWDPYYGYGRVDCLLALSYKKQPEEIIKMTEERMQTDELNPPVETQFEQKKTQSKTAEPSKPK